MICSDFGCILESLAVMQTPKDTGTVVGPRGLIKKHELVRIIIQCLYSLGYSKAAAYLESESGIMCKSPEFESLESQILDGNWDDCVQSLDKIKGLTDETRASVSFLVLEQCLLECLDCGNISLALDILRKQFSSLKISTEMVHKLSYELLSLKGLGLGCINSDSVQELRKRLLSNLEKVLPPPITLPERRLEHLVEMAISALIDGCTYHSSSDPISLYRDHHCDRDQFPTKTFQVDFYTYPFAATQVVRT